MKEITERLHNKVMAGFMPMIEQMAQEGCDKNQIVGAFQAQMRRNVVDFYNKQREPKPLMQCFDFLEELKNADSKAETVFYGMMQRSGINFTFQYVIGPYRVDYLVNKFLIIEIDGPQHNEKRDGNRDKYLRKMGYKIIRIPLWILVSCPEAAIEEIKEASLKGRASP